MKLQFTAQFARALYEAPLPIRRAFKKQSSLAKPEGQWQARLRNA
jgi:hypothetical protein